MCGGKEKDDADNAFQHLAILKVHFSMLHACPLLI